MKPIAARKRELKTIQLDRGSHDKPETGMCFMEAAAWITGQPFTDHPSCVSPVIGAFGRSWNDSLTDDARQMLKPYIVKVLDTRTSKADEETRAWLATDWMVREFAPAWLRLAGLTEHAEALGAVAPVLSDAAAKLAQPALSAALSVALSAARSAADSAALSAALSAADSAALSAARSVALSVAYSAARSPARSVAYSAARSVALSAALSAARSAADSPARSAAYSALEPTVKILQKSALRLLDRMIAVGKTEAA